MRSVEFVDSCKKKKTTKTPKPVLYKCMHFILMFSTLSGKNCFILVGRLKGGGVTLLRSENRYYLKGIRTAP